MQISGTSSYVTKDQFETSVLFELIATRYQRRSLLITANQPFGEWGKIFSDQAMTLATIDRLVHHATILNLTMRCVIWSQVVRTHQFTSLQSAFAAATSDEI